MLIIISAIVLGKQYDLKPKSKNLVLLSDLFLYFVSGFSLSCVIFDGNMAWWAILCHILIGLSTSLLFAVFLNREKEIYAKGEEYTKETLIGKKGQITEVISGSFANGFKCLGQLYDDRGTNVSIHLLPTDIVDNGDEFTIVEINGDRIIAKKRE